MTAERSFTLALERHDRHTPFFMNGVRPPDGVRIVPLEIGVGIQSGRRDGNDRHGRMFRDHEFDICEQSLSSYIIAKTRGAPFIATPVFPRRLFSQSCIFVNRNSEIESPADLAGKRIGILSFQTTLCVQARGDLKTDYGLDWRGIEWFVQQGEELSWQGDDTVVIRRIPDGVSAAGMLLEGKLDGLIMPNPPPELRQNCDQIRPLFADIRGESAAYFRRHGFCPIMHVMVFPSKLVEAEPWLPGTTIDLFDQATRTTYEYYDDPNYSLLLFAREDLEYQKTLLGRDPWTSGLASNRQNLETFISYLLDQGLIETTIDVEELFHPSVIDT